MGAKRRISEQEIEDWICENPKTLLPDLRIVDRQVRLEHGILDVLGWNERTQVIEVKARELKEQDIGQVLRYAHDVRAQLRSIGAWECPFEHIYKKTREERTVREEAFRQNWNWFYSLSDASIADPTVVPVLVGAAADYNLLAASSAAEIMVFTWQVTSEGFSFRHDMGMFFPCIDKPTPQWAYKLSRYIKEEIEWAVDEAWGGVIVDELLQGGDLIDANATND